MGVPQGLRTRNIDGVTPRAGEDGRPSSHSREESKVNLPLPLVPRRLSRDWVTPTHARVRASAVPHPLIQMLTSSRNTLTDTPRVHV